MIAVTNRMFHWLKKHGNISGSFSVKSETFERKYKEKEFAPSEVVFNYQSGETAIATVHILSVAERKPAIKAGSEENNENKKIAFPYIITAEFFLTKTVDTKGDVPFLFQDKEFLKK